MIRSFLLKLFFEQETKMNFIKNFRWVGLLLMIAAISAVLTAILEDITGTDQGLPGTLFILWFFCNTFGMLGLVIFYFSSGSKPAGWINLIGLAVFYIMSRTGRVELGFGLGFILFAAAAALGREMPGWVTAAWLLAGITVFAYQILPQSGVLSYFNAWFLGLGLATFVTGLVVWKKVNPGPIAA